MSFVKLITSQLLGDCVHHINNANTIYLLVSFVMKSGVKLLVPSLWEAAKLGADIKILAGDYLYVTEPEALAELCAVNESIEVRLWKSHGQSFHPKAYIFRKTIGEDVVIVGSSNLSQSALTTGVEWSLSLASQVTERAIEDAEDNFLKLFYASQTVPVNTVSIEEYGQEYEKHHQQNPNWAKLWVQSEEVGDGENEDFGSSNESRDDTIPYIVPIVPRPAQVEALEQLQITRSEGYDKALVIMATGLGKTYLAALFAKDFKRILFISHREEILLQARQAFKSVFPDKSMGLFNGREKNDETDIVFASVYTLGRKHHRTRFGRRRFDLIVVDEFHHSAAATYQAVIEWFQPKFLLGITATPDRSDGRDVYGICDGNVAYRMELLEAVQRGWLAPFRYFGVYDDTNYSQIRWLGSHYDERELLQAQTRDAMANLILEAWEKYAQTRGLAFCSSVAQAKFLTAHFQSSGVRAVTLDALASPALRASSITKLQNGDVDLIFTVDLFNEGVDIPAVDTLLFVRPTESLTVFTQQLGRGLRIHPGKSHCTVIDLIGNYRNADLKLSVLDAAESVGTDMRYRTIHIPPRVPGGCEFHLDLRVRDLIKAMQTKRQPRKDMLRESYRKVKYELGRRPTYREMHLFSDADSRQIKQEFGSYVGFLEWLGELLEEERRVFAEFLPWLREIESTSMTKSYKMVLLFAMLQRGKRDWHKPVAAVEVAPFFYTYYMSKEYRRKIDFSDKDKVALAEYDERRVATLIEKNPMTFWSGSSKGLAGFDGTRFGFLLSVPDDATAVLFQWTSEICEYRLHVYFERKGHAITQA